MPETFDALRFENALAHQGRLLRLAHRLLGDPGTAEDAVDHALLQESRGRRADGTPLPRFLSATVRNFALRRRRDDNRRRRHEQAAARSDDAPAADELVQREQLRRRVADAVLSLDEPYRTTVALVYLEEVPPAAAALRLGVAEATVRVRLHRAREQLRRRLDREFGARAVWALLLGSRDLAPAPALAVVGGLLMKKLMILCAVVLFLAVGWWSLPIASPVAPSAAPVVVAAAAASPAAELGVERVAVTVEPPPAVAPGPTQQFRCIDEQGRPVADAEVRLQRLPTRGKFPVLVARSDEDGVASFADVPAADYDIRAQAGLRHRVPHPDDRFLRLPAPRPELLLRELWVGGLSMAGAEARQWQFWGGGFVNSADRVPEKELTTTLQVQHPGAVFFARFRDLTHGDGDELQVQVSWFGHAAHRQKLRLWPASVFPGPEVVEPDAVARLDWAMVRVILVDAVGNPLPDLLQTTLRDRADLYGGRDDARPDMSSNYSFRNGTAMLPVGDYRLRLYDASEAHMVPVAECSITLQSEEVRIVTPTTERVLRLHLRGLDAAGYMLQVVHESGRKQLEFGRASGNHELLLPPGLCMLGLHRLVEGDRSAVVERAITIGDEVAQDVTWDVGPPPR